MSYCYAWRIRSCATNGRAAPTRNAAPPAVKAGWSRHPKTVVVVLGLSQESGFAKYHHLLNRACWSPLALSQGLLLLLLDHFDTGQGPLVFGLDETLERRWGPKIRARGIYRDAVASSRSHLVKASGLRWLCLMWLAPIPWAGRVWALPFLTALAPSERYYLAQGQTPKKLTQWARQLILQARRWLPGQRGRPRRKGACLPTLGQKLHEPATHWSSITVPRYDRGRRTLEIASDTSLWYHSGLPAVSLRWVLIRDPLGEFQPQALLCTDPAVAAPQIVPWFVLRWQLEVTFQEARAHLGLEAQRQWSDQAIGRTTPLLLGLFSWVALVAHQLGNGGTIPVRTAAWYDKSRPTFSDAIALVRQRLWCHAESFCMSPQPPDMVEIPGPLLSRLIETACYAA